MARIEPCSAAPPALDRSVQDLALEAAGARDWTISDRCLSIAHLVGAGALSAAIARAARANVAAASRLPAGDKAFGERATIARRRGAARVIWNDEFDAQDYGEGRNRKSRLVDYAAPCVDNADIKDASVDRSTGAPSDRSSAPRFEAVPHCGAGESYRCGNDDGAFILAAAAALVVLDGLSRNAERFGGG